MAIAEGPNQRPIWAALPRILLRERQSTIPILIAALMGIALSAPGIGLPYLFDDYNFLMRAASSGPQSLLPEPHAVFYRPISRDLYFGLLTILSPRSAVLGHLFNAALFAAIVFMGAGLAWRLSGERAGILAGLLIATLGQWAVLIAWISGVQDLFAIVFVLISLHLALSGRNWLSLLAFCLALLSKETALACAPVLVLSSWLRSRSWRDTYSAGMRIAVLVLIWAAIHPGVRSFVATGGEKTPGSYIGIHHPNPWVAFARYLGIALNIPSARHTTSVPTEVLWAALSAAVLLIVALGFLRKRDLTIEPRQSIGARRSEAVVFGVLLAACPMLLTAVIVHNWVPYYVCVSSIGVSIVAATFLATESFPKIAVSLCVYFVLGIWSRGADYDSGTTSERALRRIGAALKTVEANFKRVAPVLPTSSIAYVSTLVTSKTSIYAHMYSIQVLRAWYGDATIQTIRPELKVLSSSPEALFCIEPSLNVLRIDPRTLAVHSAGGEVDPRDYRSVMMAYVIGLAEVGDLERSTNILLNLSPPGSWENLTNVRVAAMLLLAKGEAKASADLLRGLPMIPTEDALRIVGTLLTIPYRGGGMEAPALLAFGFSPDDPTVLRRLLRPLLSLGYFEVSERLANRLLALSPGDIEAREALEKIKTNRAPENRMIPEIEGIPFPDRK